MLSTILTLLAILYLPGAIIFRLPLANRPKRGALPAEERLFWAVIVSVIVTTTATLALAALGAYTLSRVVAFNIALAAAGALAARGNLAFDRGERAGVRWSAAAVPALLVVLATTMYFAVPPAEWVLGGRDPGVYLNEGIQIAQRRSLMTTDPVVASVPPPARDLFFPPHDDSDSYYSMRFMGFHLRDPAAGTVSGQFPQGFPAWIAIAYGMDGLSGARRVISWWAILGVLATYFAARRLVGPVAAAAAAALLTVHIVQTWYARYPNSEMMTQALLFSGLLAHAYAHEEDDAFFGPISGSLLGLALFTRFPEVIAVGAAVGATLLAHVNGHKASKSFLLTLIVWLWASWSYYTTQLAPYFARPLSFIWEMDFFFHGPLRAAAVAIAVFVLATYNRRIAGATRRWLPIALALAISIAAFYAYFLREPGGRLAPHDAHGLRTFVDLYLTLPAFGLAMLGYALVFWRSFWRAPALILAFTTLSAFFFYKLRIFPEHFWLARRFVPMILPGALILAAGAALAPLWLFTREQRMTPRGATLTTAWVAVGTIALALIGWSYLAASGPIRRHIEYAGIIPRLEQFAGAINADDLILVEAREASDVHVLALPLAYIYGRDVLVLARSRPDKAAFAQFLGWARQRYKSVYFVAGGGTDLLSPGIGSEVVSSYRFQVPEYDQTPYPVLPQATLQKPFDFTTYRLVESRSTSAPSSLDIGGADDLHVVNFFPKERLRGGAVNFRWTQDLSHLRLAVGPRSRDLVLRLSSGRAPGAGPAKITVSIGSRELGAAEPTAEFRDYVFRLPDSVAELVPHDGLAEFELRSTTWSPHEVLNGRDVRNLGVMVDRAEIR